MELPEVPIEGDKVVCIESNHVSDGHYCSGEAPKKGNLYLVKKSVMDIDGRLIIQLYGCEVFLDQFSSMEIYWQATNFRKLIPKSERVIK